MRREISLKKGLDLNLKGSIDKSDTTPVAVGRVAVVPDDFQGFVPKLDVKEGDEVTQGQSLMHDKNAEAVKLASPVAGVVKAIVRGDRRKIMRVEIDACREKNGTTTFEVNPDSAESIKAALMESGLWALMRQRPYDIVPNVAKQPRDIFVTAFDSAPLAPDLSLYVKGKEKEIEAGTKALKMLTPGNVYISVRKGEDIKVPQQATEVLVSGPHPSGNAGVQAANIAPVDKGDTVWTLDIVTLARIGGLMLNRTVDWNVTVAVTGPEVYEPRYVSTVAGAEIAPLLEGNVKSDDRHHRIISGNVLTGITTSGDRFIHYPYRQITVIAEGDDVDEFMGWASMSPNKMSVSRSFPSWFMRKKSFAPDARINGGRRAMIMSGEYDKVLPMDILPEYLIKAAIARDIDKMEQLGIYEIAPEDMALCEYVDPSKIEIQKIIRDALDYMRKELDD